MFSPAIEQQQFSGFLDDIKKLLSASVKAVAPLIKQVPGVDTAIQTIKFQIGRFFQIPLRLVNLRKRTNSLLEVARQKNNNIAAGKLIAIQSATTVIESKYRSTESKLTDVLDGLKEQGLGLIPVIPIVLGGSAVMVAGTITYLLKAVSFQEKVLRNVESGLLSPKEAQALFGKRAFFGFGLGGMTTPLLIGGGILLFLMMPKKKRR